MTDKPKIGIFGGSFDPIHVGHLALANYICEFEQLDELWFMLTPQNPLKTEKAGATEKQRFELIQLAIQDYPRFKASDFELHLKPPYYTAKTLGALRSQYADKEFILIIGSDNWNSFDQWKNPQDIKKNHKILIYPRADSPIISSDLPKGVRLMDSPIFEVSSTLIREAFAQGINLPYFLHPEVYKVIKEKGLYLE
ncbi:MAG: nicotinate-nucleotide adenylyltransferase [Bacteroidales bacterium]|nr:nicotinate-nucleotide adenylyltransferase [Bacteroidales bacterium]